MLLPVVDNFWQAGKLEAIGGNSMAVLATAFATTHTNWEWGLGIWVYITVHESSVQFACNASAPARLRAWSCWLPECHCISPACTMASCIGLLRDSWCQIILSFLSLQYVRAPVTSGTGCGIPPKAMLFVQRVIVLDSKVAAARVFRHARSSALAEASFAGTSQCFLDLFSTSCWLAAASWCCLSLRYDDVLGAWHFFAFAVRPSCEWWSFGFFRRIAKLSSFRLARHDLLCSLRHVWRKIPLVLRPDVETNQDLIGIWCSWLADLRSSSEALDLVSKCFNMFRKQLENTLEFVEVETRDHDSSKGGLGTTQTPVWHSAGWAFREGAPSEPQCQHQIQHLEGIRFLTYTVPKKDYISDCCHQRSS